MFVYIFDHIKKSFLDKMTVLFSPQVYLYLFISRIKLIKYLRKKTQCVKKIFSSKPIFVWFMNDD